MSPARQEFSRSWRVVAAAMVGMGLGYGGLPVYCFGVFVAPLANETGWAISAVGNWMFCASIAYSLLVPMVGRLTDRWGARRVSLLSVPLFALALMSVSLVRHSLWGFYLSGVAVGIVGAGTTAIVYARAISTSFHAAWGTALGMMTAGIGIASTFAPYILQVIVDRHGWRAGFAAMSLMAAGALPVVFAWLYEGNGRREQGAVSEIETTRSDAMRRPVFWLIAGAYAITCLANGGVLVYLVPFLIASGLSGPESAAYAGLLGIASIAGRLSGGFIIDRLHVALVCASLLTIQALATIALGMGDPSYAPFLILTIGFALGAESDCVIYSTTRYFGLKAFGELWGIFGLFGGVSSASGSACFGYLLEAAGSYRVAFLTCAALLLLAAALFVQVGRHRFPEEASAKPG